MSLVQMSVYGGVMILVTLAVRTAARSRLTKLTLVALWGLCVLRLLIPLNLPSVFSVYTALDTAAEQVVEAAGGAEPAALEAVRGFMRPSPVTTAPVNAPDLPEPVVKSISPWTVIWMTGGTGLALFFLMAYLHSRRRFRTAVPEVEPALLAVVAAERLRRQVRLARANVSSPLTYGVVCPVILLPLDGEEDAVSLNYVLTHELVHIRRFDGLKKLALICTLCLHWFNPLVWLLYVYANRDIELACDDGVLARMGRDSRSGYAMTLIGYAEVQGLAMFSAFGQHSIEERIRTVMKYKPKTVTASLVSLCVLVAVTIGFITGCTPSEPLDTTPEPETEQGTQPQSQIDTATRPGWDAPLAFSEAVIQAADIPAGDLETINGLLAESGTLSARELRQRFTDATEVSDTLFESANNLAIAEYDIYSAYDPGLSPAGMVLTTVANEYYVDAMETPGAYSGGYTYVTDSVGLMHDEETGVYSDYYLSYFVMYYLDYTYTDDTAITTQEVAKRMSDFGSALYAYVDPLLVDGMTEAEAKAAFAGADVEGKMAELLTAIDGDGVNFTLSDVEIDIGGWGDWEPEGDEEDARVEQGIDPVTDLIQAIPHMSIEDLLSLYRDPQIDGAVAEAYYSNLADRLIADVGNVISAMLNSDMDGDTRVQLARELGGHLAIVGPSEADMQPIYTARDGSAGEEAEILAAMIMGYESQ